MATMKIVVSVAFLVLVECRPPVQQHPGGQGVPLQKETNITSDRNMGLEYNRYLQEVVQVLESDPEFRKKLETADIEKIRDGSIAHELEMVNHQVRSQLDVIKRKELERLRHLAMRQFELQNGIDKRGRVKMPQHIELQNPTFEIEDLKKLIKMTTKDLEEADRKRRDEFKRYEMEKKFEHNQRLQHIEDEAKRQEEEARMEELEQKHRQHGKINHPMTKDQLEGVWEEQDHMRPQDWDPKTFFAMHDLNGDKYWDEDEVRVLFKKELDKAYDPNAPEDDMREREEEMERMREHVFGESDLNKDRLISFEEFLAETKRDEFEKDPGWDMLDQDKSSPFTDEEFKAYEMQRMREIQGMINRGVIPEGYPNYGAVPPGVPVQPQFGGHGQPYMPPVHQGQLQQGQGMNIQPLHGEANYRQPPHQFGAGQPQQQFGQPQQFAQQQYGQQIPQQHQFGKPQQQQQFNQQHQFAPQQPQQGQQQYAAPPSQQQGQAGPDPSGVKVSQQQPVEKSQENHPPPQPRDQPVIQAPKIPADAASAQQQQKP